MTGRYIGDKNHRVKEKSEKTGNFYWTSFERPRTRIPRCRPGRPAGESRGPVPAGTASAWGSGPRIVAALRPGKQSKFDGAGRTRLTRLFPEREKYKNRADPIREAPHCRPGRPQGEPGTSAVLPGLDPGRQGRGGAERKSGSAPARRGPAWAGWTDAAILCDDRRQSSPGRSGLPVGVPHAREAAR